MAIDDLIECRICGHRDFRQKIIDKGYKCPSCMQDTGLFKVEDKCIDCCFLEEKNRTLRLRNTKLIAELMQAEINLNETKEDNLRAFNFGYKEGFKNFATSLLAGLEFADEKEKGIKWDFQELEDIVEQMLEAGLSQVE